MQVLKQEILDLLTSNTKAVARLAYELNKHSNTIDRWIATNNVALTCKTATVAISEELNVPEQDLLTEESDSIKLADNS